ncbi:unnamed protein product [Ixodes hexagonus]
MADATLTGFSSFLDWKRLTFQRPLPRAWICDLCGLVSQTSMVTGCLHAFCLDCYKHIQAEKEPKCPLDATVINSNETKQFVLGEAQIKQLVVRCLNAQHGCDFQGPLFELENHFVKNCSFHTVTCKACRGPVLRNKILEHSKACGFQGRARAQGAAKSNVLDQGGDHALELDGLTADAVRCAGDDKVNILVESMRKCSHSVNDLVDLAKNLVESVQHCVRATDESTSKTSDLVGSVDNCTEVVKNVQAICKYIPNNWLTRCFQPGHLGTNQHVFVCRNFSAKVAGAPVNPGESWHFYPAWCPQGEVMIKGYQVQLAQAIYVNQTKERCVAFKLTFVSKTQAAGGSIDVTLVLVHPTQANLNKSRPLKSDELFYNANSVKDFCFTADSLREQGFVADEMLLLCLEAIE